MLRLCFALAIATWLGAVVSVSFVVTPIAHSTFSSVEARRFLRPIFPRYYMLGLGCGLVALLAIALGRHGLAEEELLRLSVPVAIALVATLVATGLILPRLRVLDGSDERFGRLHQASAMLNTTTLGALVLAMAAAVAR
jgi:hypothetical protein